MEKQFNETANKGGVYRIINKINGNSYIGSTNSFKQRIAEHEHSLRNGTHKNPKLRHAFKKYGEDAFIFEVLEIVEGDMFERTIVEQKYLDEIKDWKKCYNIKRKTVQKQGPWSSTPEETGKKISEALKGRPGYMKGKHHTEESRKKISNSHKGQKRSVEARRNMCAAQKGHEGTMKGKYHTKETKKKISEANIKARGIKVWQYDLSDNFIKEWRAVQEAAKVLNISAPGIAACCRNKRKTCGNYRWKYATSGM